MPRVASKPQIRISSALLNEKHSQSWHQGGPLMGLQMVHGSTDGALTNNERSSLRMIVCYSHGVTLKSPGKSFSTNFTLTSSPHWRKACLFILGRCERAPPIPWLAKLKGDKNSECKLSNGWSRSYMGDKTASLCWKMSGREVTRR